MFNHDFEFGITLAGDSTLESVDDREFMAMPYKAGAVGPNEVLIRIHQSDTTLKLSMLDAHVLGLCGRWGTIRQHVDQALQQFGQQVNRTMLTASVQRLVDNGLLRSKVEWLARLGQVDRMNESGPLDVLCIRTCDRPGALENLLTSLLESPATNSLIHCLVLDDSKESENTQANGRLVKQCRDRADFSVTHFKPTDRNAWIEGMARDSGVNADALDWFMSGDVDDDQPGYGGNVNLALLLTAGRRIALMDDDMEFRMFAMPNSRQSLELVDSQRRRLDLIEHERDIGEQFDALEIDPLTEHGHYVGASLGELINARGHEDGDPLGALTPALAADLNAMSRVRICNHGTLGDPGTRRAGWFFANHLDALRPYFDQPERCRQMVYQRRFAMASEGVQVDTETILMLAFTGLDNRELLLPTQPRGANEDLLLGTLVQFAYPSSLQVHLPWMMGHRLNSAVREWTEDDLVHVPGFSRGGFLSDALRNLSAGLPPGLAASRIELLKGYMGSLVDMRDSDIGEQIQDFSLQRRASLARQLEAAIRLCDPPDLLRKDIQRMIDANLAADVFEQHMPANLIDSIRQVATGYHRHLDEWCVAWRWCRDNDVLASVGRS